MRVQLNVLGPLAALIDGHPVDLGGPRQLAVLAALVLTAPRPVTTQEMVELCWPAGTEGSRASVQFYLSQLRRTLGSSETPAVTRRGSGYVLGLPPEAVDVTRFERLARAGTSALREHRPAEAERELAAALALWRGRAYEPLGDLDLVVPEAARLEELRLGAHEAHLEALLALGDEDEVVGGARALTARHPLRERGWELLALALYRTGRQGDALGALRSARGVLAEELGVDPGARLVALEAAVLAQDPQLGVGRAATAGTVTEPAGPATAGEADDPAPAPVPLTPLVGREALVADIHAHLRRSRLVTLTGLGGAGKTRLAVEVAHGHRHAAPGARVAFVELAGLDDPHLVPAVVARALALPPAQDDADLARALHAWLGSSPALLVLDDLERLLPTAAATVRAVLGRCPGLRVLLTSRQDLGIPGEVILEVSGLPEQDALELVLDRAAAAVPGWLPTAQDRVELLQVCAGLDGLPLALELAAARLRVLTPAELVVALTDPSATLGDAIAATALWSHADLGTAERTLLLRLAALSGPFDVETAQALWSGPVVPVIGTLVRRSLVSVRPSTSRRYRLLQTVRRLALAQADGPERADAQARHRAWVLARASAAHRDVRGPHASEALALLEADRPEHRGALTSALAHGVSGYAADLVAALGWSWYRGGHLAEGISAARRTLPLLVGDDPSTAARRARVRHVLGQLSYLAGDAPAADEAFEEALRDATAADERTVAATASTWLAYLRTFTVGPQAALPLARTALDRARDLGPEGPAWVAAEACMVIGLSLRAAGSGDEARAALAAAAEAARACGYAWAEVSSTWGGMKAAVDAGDLDGALAAAARMRAPLAADRDVTSWLVLLHTTAGVLARTGRADDAARLLGVVAAHGERLGFDPGQMDPRDGPVEAAAVWDALPAPRLNRLLAEGGLLTRPAVDALLDRVLPGSGGAGDRGSRQQPVGTTPA